MSETSEPTRISVDVFLGRCSTCEAPAVIVNGEMRGQFQLVRNDQGQMFVQPHRDDCPRLPSSRDVPAQPVLSGPFIRVLNDG